MSNSTYVSLSLRWDGSGPMVARLHLLSDVVWPPPPAGDCILTPALHVCVTSAFVTSKLLCRLICVPGSTPMPFEKKKKIEVKSLVWLNETSFLMPDQLLTSPVGTRGRGGRRRATGRYLHAHTKLSECNSNNKQISNFCAVESRWMVWEKKRIPLTSFFPASARVRHIAHLHQSR